MAQSTSRVFTMKKQIWEWENKIKIEAFIHW